MTDSHNETNINGGLDHNTYTGRAKYFFLTTNPLNLLVTNSQLEDIKSLMTKIKHGQPLSTKLSDKELLHVKTIYESAFHPDTGEKMNIIGRMSAQVPMNVLITAGMITFYKSTAAVVFWQWLNQSFSALVNYTNRSGDVVITNKQILTCYAMATGGAVGTALGLNSLVKKMPPLIGRMVPFAAVAAANCINVPMMRQLELKNGTAIYDENNNKLGYSKIAAQRGIAQVVFTRICMAFPGMVSTPFVLDYLEKRGVLRKYPWIGLPTSLTILTACLLFSTPLSCAIFKQRASIPCKDLEPELQEEILKKYDSPQVVFYNKGL